MSADSISQRDEIFVTEAMVDAAAINVAADTAVTAAATNVVAEIAVYAVAAANNPATGEDDDEASGTAADPLAGVED